MSIISFLPNLNGCFTKGAKEVVMWGNFISKKTNNEVIGVTYGTPLQEEIAKIEELGIEKLIIAENINGIRSLSLSNFIFGLVKEYESKFVLFPHDFAGRALGGILSSKINGYIYTNVSFLEILNDSIYFTTNYFGGKGTIHWKGKIDKPIVFTFALNSIVIEKEKKGAIKVEKKSVFISDKDEKVLSIKDKGGGKIPLTEAEIVISGGRGMKGPENWKLLEELADLLGGALACSRPVADAGWRPHHEHVGQTGTQIAPNVYIAVGISGAIQHVAGISGSKHIIVINKDKEAPFTRYADYFLEGDLFEILPKLTEKIKKLKQQ